MVILYTQHCLTKAKSTLLNEKHDSLHHFQKIKIQNDLQKY